MLGIRPLHAADPTRCQLIDIRPRQERLGGLGFIPGSLSVPRTDDLEDDAQTIDQLAGSKLPVLVCLDGQRSRALVLALSQALELPLGYLEGGILAWGLADLTLCGRLGDSDTQLAPMTLTGYHRMIRTRLDALWSQVPIDLGDPTNFVLERCAVGLGSPVERWQQRELLHFPDVLAVVLLDLKVPRDRVGALVDRLIAQMPELDIATTLSW